MRQTRFLLTLGSLKLDKRQLDLLDIYAVHISDSKWIAPSPAQLIIKRLS